jgi:hypothetical protein
LWEDVTETELDEAFAAAAWLDGVREVFADITLRLLDELGVAESECVGYGSTSDVLLFDRLRHTVGVNPAPVLRERCAVVYEGSDMREGDALGRGLLDRSEEQPAAGNRA